MLGELEKNMMVKFLQKNYPVSRIKDTYGQVKPPLIRDGDELIYLPIRDKSVTGRFKRAIMLDDGTIYHLGNTAHTNILLNKLTIILSNIFYTKDEFTINIVKSFLNIR